MELEEQLHTASITSIFAEAHKAVVKLTHLAYGGTPDTVDEGEHADEFKQAEKTLAWHGSIPKNVRATT
jgi:hypothetical protein